MNKALSNNIKCIRINLNSKVLKYVFQFTNPASVFSLSCNYWTKILPFSCMIYVCFYTFMKWDGGKRHSGLLTRRINLGPTTANWIFYNFHVSSYSREAISFNSYLVFRFTRWAFKQKHWRYSYANIFENKRRQENVL